MTAVGEGPSEGHPFSFCNYHRVKVRELSPEDAGWAAEMMEHRQQEYARYSPVFWRPALDAVGLHARFLTRQILADSNIALRTGRGFIICQRRPDEGLVDDFAVEQAGLWGDDGAALLLAVADRLNAAGTVTAIRVVTAHADQPRSACFGGCRCAWQNSGGCGSCNLDVRRQRRLPAVSEGQDSAGYSGPLLRSTILVSRSHWISHSRFPVPTGRSRRAE
jgi:hypothetical protein